MCEVFRDFRIDTARLRLRLFTFEDAEPLNAIISDKRVMKYLPDDFTTREEIDSLLSWLIKCYTENTIDNIIKFTVAIEYLETGEFIGWCGFGPLEFDLSEIELYYSLAKDYWNRGLASEASIAMLDYGFTTIGLPKLVAVAAPENKASLRVIEKIGFKFKKQIKGLADEFLSYENDLYFTLTKDEYFAKTD